MAGHDNIPTLAEQVSRVPTQPGCYLWKDAKGDVIYVGKAKNLRARMRQYVTLQDERQKIPLMMQLVASFDYIVVETEHEALVLERNLIGQYHPYFNVDLKDDKSYPFIAITKGDLYPAIKYTRERHKPGTRYFGPYTDSRAARETIDTLRKVIPICSASCAEWRRCRRIVESHKGEEDIVNMICAQNGRPCFDYHVGRGPGACVGAISPADYAKNVKRVERFLSGHRKDVVDELTSEMTDAAEALDFERAARVKRRLEVIRGLDDRQQVVFPSSVDIDVIGFYREETISAACVFVVREGRTVRTCEFILDKGLDVDEEELQSGFLKRYYDETADIPAEVNLSVELEDAEALGEWLAGKRERSCHLHRPQRGEKHRLLDMASKNARHALMRYMMRTGYADDRTNQALLELESALAQAKEAGVYQAFVMDEVFDKMETGEAAISAYYAGDYLTMLETNPDLKYVVPEEGSNWFVDAMCVLKDAENKDEAEEWINFLCSTDASLKNMDYIWYASPNKEALEQYPEYYEETYGEELDPELYEIMAAPQEVLKNCEAYLVRPAATRTLYNDLWTDLGILA